MCVFRFGLEEVNGVVGVGVKKMNWSGCCEEGGGGERARRRS